MSAMRIILVAFRGLLVGRATLIAENLALRQQLAILSRSGKRPRLRQRDRIFWVWTSRLWKDWRSSLVVTQPDTVVRWHRRGLQVVLALKVEEVRSSEGRCRDPKTDPENLPKQSALGSAEGASRASPARSRRGRVNSRQIHGPAPSSPGRPDWSWHP